MISPKRYLLSIKRPAQFKKNRLDYLRLDGNESPLEFNEKFLDEIRENITSKLITAYPELELFYKNLANYLNVETDNLIITPGSELAIKQVLETYCNNSDEVMIIHPTYGMFQGYCELLNIKYKLISISQNLKINIQDIFNSFNKRTKIIAIANPNGNTGSFLKDYEILELLKFGKDNNVLILLDQAYIEFSTSNLEYSNLINEYDNLIIIRTFSKSLGMAGLRIGFILSNHINRENMMKMKPVHEISSLSAMIGNLLITEYAKDIEINVNILKKSKYFLEKEMKKRKIKTFPGEGNFIQIFLFDYKDNVIKKLKSRYILVKDNGDSGILAGSIRVTLGNQEQMQKLVEVIDEVIN